MTDNTSIAEPSQSMFSSRDLTKLIIPVIIEQFFAVLIGLMDIIMVAVDGEKAISSISLVDSINILIINLFSALATGGAVIVSQYLGMREREKACNAAKQLQYISLFISAAVAAVSLLFGNSILSLIFGKIDPEIMEKCRIYFFISALSYPFLAIYNSGAALFRSMGNSKISMYISLMMNTLNVIGNYILIYIFRFGVFGAALASLVARMVGCIYINVMLLNKKNAVFIEHPFRFRPNFFLIRKIFKIGIPTGLENCMFQFGKLFMSHLVSTFGQSSIAANAVSNSIISFSNVPGQAIGLAIITIVGQCIGAGKKDQAYQYSRRLLRLTYLIMIGINLTVILLSSYITASFNLEPGSAALTKEIIIIFSIVSSLIWPLAFTIPNSLRAAGDVNFSMIVSIASMWIFRVLLGYILCLGFHFGLHGVWIAMYVDWVCRLIFYVWRFYGKTWLNRRVL